MCKKIPTVIKWETHVTLMMIMTMLQTTWYVPFNFLPNKILDWTKFKEFADNKKNVTQKLKFDLGRVKNMVKGENAVNELFLLSPQCFQKVSFPGSLKDGIVW